MIPLCVMAVRLFFFFNDTATTEIYTLPLHDALPISTERGTRAERRRVLSVRVLPRGAHCDARPPRVRRAVRGPVRPRAAAPPGAPTDTARTIEAGRAGAGSFARNDTRSRAHADAARIRPARPPAGAPRADAALHGARAQAAWPHAAGRGAEGLTLYCSR